MIREGIQQEQSLFKAVMLHGGQYAFIPSDLDILIPKAPRIAGADRHHLAYIPWENKYLEHVPEEYRSFFRFVLPHLHARTTNVHTALSIGQLTGLLNNGGGSVRERIVYLALILHDCGWSQVSQHGILTSLNYNGVMPTGKDSVKPKQQHLVYGAALAYKLLDSFDFGSVSLSSDDMYLVSEMVRRHDHDSLWERGKYGAISQEIKLLCDSDRLWSYTHENFWLDTIRKNVPPASYLELITAEIDTYFATAAGKRRARALIRDRKAEVADYLAVMEDAEARARLAYSARHPSKRVLYRAQQLLLSAKSRRIQRGHIRQNAF